MSLPSIQELRESSSKELAFKTDQFNALLYNSPPDEWIKTHPFIKGWKYLPIEKVEFLLKKIFKVVNIEILREGVSFNGVYVVVRINYTNPVTQEKEFQDGIGACQLQTKQGTSPSDLININNGAISMAFPIAESFAIKDAAEKLGSLFGANLNRKDVIEYQPDKEKFDITKILNSDDVVFCREYATKNKREMTKEEEIKVREHINKLADPV